MGTSLAREYADTVAGELFAAGPDQLLADDGGALEVRRLYTAEATLARIEVLITYGGPGVWLLIDPYETELRVSWGSDTVREYRPTLTAWREMFD